MYPRAPRRVAGQTRQNSVGVQCTATGQTWSTSVPRAYYRAFASGFQWFQVGGKYSNAIGIVHEASIVRDLGHPQLLACPSRRSLWG
jgi:hypothetical protein